MKRRNWYESSHALRKLLRELPVTGRATNASPRAVFKFGAVYHRQRKLWYIFNLKSDNVIATVKKGRNRVIIRYRPKSFYASILCRYNYAIETSQVESPNLRQHRRWARDELREMIQNEFNNWKGGEKDFLAPNTYRLAIAIPPELVAHSPQTNSEVPSQVHLVTILFEEEPNQRTARGCQCMVQNLARDGVEINSEMPFNELIDLYNHTMDSRRGTSMSASAELTYEPGAVWNIQPGMPIQHRVNPYDGLTDEVRERLTTAREEMERTAIQAEMDRQLRQGADYNMHSNVRWLQEYSPSIEGDDDDE